MNVSNDNSVKFEKDDRAYVYAVARHIVRTPEAADDVTQDALLLAYRHRDSFRGDSRYRTWLYRIACTTALEHLRRARKTHERIAPTPEIAAIEVPDPARSPEALVADAEVASEARRAVEDLPEKYRDILLARAELTEAETAARLGISIANVKIRTHRARAQLRESLSGARRQRAARRSASAAHAGRAR